MSFSALVLRSSQNLFSLPNNFWSCKLLRLESVFLVFGLEISLVLKSILVFGFENSLDVGLQKGLQSPGFGLGYTGLQPWSRGPSASPFSLEAPRKMSSSLLALQSRGLQAFPKKGLQVFSAFGPAVFQSCGPSILKTGFE